MRKKKNKIKKKSGEKKKKTDGNMGYGGGSFNSVGGREGGREGGFFGEITLLRIFE